MVGPLARVSENSLNAGTPFVGTVNGPWIIDLRERSLRKDWASQGNCWGLECWLEKGQAGKQLEWAIADHDSCFSVALLR